MNKKGIIVNSFIFSCCLGFSLILLFGVPHNKNNSTKEEKEVVTDVFTEKIHNTLNSLTLEEKIAQMLIIDISGTKLDSYLKNELTTYKPGGIILFEENISNYDNTVKLITDIQNTAAIPMFISIDQEGGKVVRIKDIKDVNVSNIPSMWELGQTDDAILAYNFGKVIGEELRAFHINMNFAPVLDLVNDENSKFIGSRSFGPNPDNVSKMALALSNGLNDSGVISVFKHFPGHGSTVTDSHYELPILEKSKEELQKYELIPFQKAIDNGAQVIMVGHLGIPKITNDTTPASLSKTLITDLLKNEMNYNGLIITDALNMKAITNYYTEQEIYEMAINAGVDILLMPKSLESAISLIKDSINKGIITIEQIDKSVEKILNLKYSSLSNIYPDKDIIGNSEHQEIIAKIK